MYELRLVEKPVKRMPLLARPPIDFREQVRRQRVIEDALFVVGSRLEYDGRMVTVTAVMALLKADDARRLTWERDMALYELTSAGGWVLLINEAALIATMTGKRVATGNLPPTSPNAAA
jgi:hypothetical protein